MSKTPTVTIEAVNQVDVIMATAAEVRQEVDVTTQVSF